jgi:hypothetical protein
MKECEKNIDVNHFSFKYFFIVFYPYFKREGDSLQRGT